MTNLSGRVAIVAGTGPGIGAGIAVGLAQAGARVICLDRNQDSARACVAYLEKVAQLDGREPRAVGCDVSDPAAVEGVLDEIFADVGVVDVLVNGASFYNEKGLLEMPLAEWVAQLGTILTGTFLLTAGVAKRLVEHGQPGSIINISSTAGHQGQPGNIAYSTAKAGLLNFTRSAAMDLAPYSIRVNSLTPTSTDPSEGLARAEAWGAPAFQTTDALRRTTIRGRRLPLQKMPAPSHYAQAVVFLASGSSEMITGTDLRVDSGALSKYWAWDPDD